MPSLFVGQMTDLIFTERELVQSLKEYIEAEEMKLEAVKSWANKLDMLTRVSTLDPEGFLAHPVNAYKLMKRLNTEWSELESLVLQDPSDGFISNMSVHRQYFPDEEDEKGAAKALIRLQDTYKLDSESFSKGKLPDPSHQRAGANLHYFERLLSKELRDRGQGQQEPADEKPIQLDTYERPKDYLPEREVYEALCRGEGVKMTEKRRSRLFCRYQDGSRSPRLLLKPMKEEDEWDSPHIVRFLEALSDEEIEKIKELAKPKLARATVRDPKTGVLTVANYRVSKSAWLEGEDDPVIARVNQRIEDVTGLTVDTAELLQVANYGVGGQYEPHYDFSRVREDVNYLSSLQMSDVEAGGATVFPDFGAAIWPRKGTAVFWYNLFKSGEGDYRTRHAACPVLVGSKWVSNKWIHERGQEFRRPCGLTEVD
uniref:procollagen-proline 4-dioxygenase n=1 Tax=Cyprinus carpio TaxID=7962 RepID=A0A8C1KSN4_CYPCA